MAKITETVCVPVKLQIVTKCAEEACFPSGIERGKNEGGKRGQGKSKWQWQGKHARKEARPRKVYYGAIRYVGVIWFLLRVLQLLPIRFTHQNSFANLRRNICKNLTENQTSPALVMVIGSECLLIS